MAKPPKHNETYSEQETAHRRDDAIRRALRTHPTHLKDIPKKRKPKSSASSKTDGDDPSA